MVYAPSKLRVIQKEFEEHSLNEGIRTDARHSTEFLGCSPRLLGQQEDPIVSRTRPGHT